MKTSVDIEHRSFEATLSACEARGGVDLIVTSPPYPNARPGQYLGDAPHDWTLPDYQRLGDHVVRALRPGGFCAINIDGPVRTTRPEVGSERSLIAFELAIDWARRVGLRYVEHCAYLRTGIPGRFPQKWQSGWEPVHIFQRPGLQAFFDPVGFTVQSRWAGNKRRRAKFRTAGRASTCDMDGYRTIAETTGPTTALGFGGVNQHTSDAEHPAPFADWLADAFVLCYCPPGGTVCDPFVGSGTVAISCAKHGRNFIGGDLGARERDGRRWSDIARERAERERDAPRQVSLAVD